MATALKNLSEYSFDALPGIENKIIGIVTSEWNDAVTQPLLDGAYDALVKHGVNPGNIMLRTVPGSYELSLGAQRLARLEAVDAVICLGCVIQGETRHFDFICQAVADGITQVNLKYNKPVIFGVLTTNNLEQAIARSGGKHGNKGIEAAITALKMLAWT